ncbi:MAG: hypothetical protein ACT4O0_13145 [Pseudonocardia sp.]
MSTTLDHPLSTVFHDASMGAFPSQDGSIDVYQPMPGPCDAFELFSGHLIVASQMPESQVRDLLPKRWTDQDADLGSHVMSLATGMYQALGQPLTSESILCSAPHTASWLHGRLVEGGRPSEIWSAFRQDIRSYRYESSLEGSGTIGIGVGPGGRHDVYIETDDVGSAASRASRELLKAAKTLVPAGSSLFGSAPVHDPRVLRTLLNAGFRPLATEVLFKVR